MSTHRVASFGIVRRVRLRWWRLRTDCALWLALWRYARSERQRVEHEFLYGAADPKRGELR